jgi:hypothetical protein
MGWKASLIIILNPDNFTDEALLLSKLGLEGFVYSEDTILDECLLPETAGRFKHLAIKHHINLL